MTSSASSLRLPCVAAAVVWALTATACADFSRGDSTTATASDGAADATDGGPSSDAPLSYAGSVQRLLVDGCMSCHTPGGEAARTSFILAGDAAADYTATFGLIDLGAPSASRLLTKMSGHGHGGGAVYGSDTGEYRTVLRWIQEGAPP